MAPPNLGEVPDCSSADLDSLGSEELAFKSRIAAIAAQASFGCHNSVTGYVDEVTISHDVADSTVGVWVACYGCNISISGNMPHGNPSNRV
mgnify:FL=1